jgi:uncharacterized repeat protein (TIGR01451 family)
VAIGCRIGPREGYGNLRCGAGFSSGPTSTTLTLSLADSADPVPAGNNFNYTASISNTGLINATSLSLAVTLDSSLTYVSSSGTGWTIGVAGQVVTCTRAVLVPGAAPDITITVTAGNSGVTASTSGTLTCTDAATVNDTETTAVQTITTTTAVADTADPVITGADAFAYTIVVHNSHATGQLNGLSVAFAIDSSLTYVSSSGTGWSFSGPSGGTLTCTRSSLAANSDAPTITVNVTTGTTGLTASSTATLTSTNGASSNGTETTVVNLVHKDATAGIYFPESATEWTNFCTRKGLPTFTLRGLWLMQEASGNLADSSGNSITLTATGSSSYQQTITGYTRKGITTTDASSKNFASTSSSLADISATSAMLFMVASINSTPVSARRALVMGTTTVRIGIDTTPHATTSSATNTATGSETLDTSIRPFVVSEDHTNSRTRGYTLADQMNPTHSGTVTGKKIVFASDSASTTPAMTMTYGFYITGSDAEAYTSTVVKSLMTAMGYSPTFTPS